MIINSQTNPGLITYDSNVRWNTRAYLSQCKLNEKTRDRIIESLFFSSQFLLTQVILRSSRCE